MYFTGYVFYRLRILLDYVILQATYLLDCLLQTTYFVRLYFTGYVFYRLRILQAMYFTGYVFYRLRILQATYFTGYVFYRLRILQTTYFVALCTDTVTESRLAIVCRGVHDCYYCHRGYF